MTHRHLNLVAIACYLALTLAAVPAIGADETTDKPATENATAVAPSKEDQELVARVAAKIFAKADPVEGWSWPPLVYIVNYEGGTIDADNDGEVDPDEVNADANVVSLKPGEQPKYPDGTSLTLIPLPGFEHIDGDVAEDGTVHQPVLRVFQGWLTKIVQGKDDRLANCFGHEVAHVLLKHVGENETDTPLFEDALQREQESAADIRGFELALEAGYPYQPMIDSLFAERDLLSWYTRFGAFSKSHPGYTDRVALIEKNRPQVWRSLSAFEDGVLFLNHELYSSAADCFAEVVDKQPDCYEAWANLGYAKLMLYCESLDADDLRSYDMGQLVLGGFYRHADSLGIRGDGSKLWEDAIAALQHALNLNPDLVLARANLAAAYLVHPAGKDVGAAAREFDQVVKALEKGQIEEDADARVKASLFVNAGVLQMANGDPAGAEKLFGEARGLFEADKDFDAAGQVASAVRYNRAMLMARSAEPGQQRSAVGEFETYLGANSPAVAWWSLAFEAYEKLCKAQGVEPKTREHLTEAGKVARRMVISVDLGDGKALSIGEPIVKVKESLGEGVESSILRNKEMLRLRYLDRGLDLWGAQSLLAIRLMNKHAPALRLKAVGPGPTDAAEIRVGMTFDEAAALLGPDATKWDKRFGTNYTIQYRYFYNLGFGLRVSDEGHITEIIISQLPNEARVG